MAWRQPLPQVDQACYRLTCRICRRTCPVVRECTCTCISSQYQFRRRSYRCALPYECGRRTALAWYLTVFDVLKCQRQLQCQRKGASARHGPTSGWTVAIRVCFAVVCRSSGAYRCADTVADASRSTLRRILRLSRWSTSHPTTWPRANATSWATKRFFRCVRMLSGFSSWYGRSIWASELPKGLSFSYETPNASSRGISTRQAGSKV